MVAEYTMKINGEWYRAGDELPSGNAEKKVEPEKVETETKPYTKSEITLMKAANLRKIIAKEFEVDDVDNLTGTEMKKMLIEKYNL